jgi:chaperonin GroEL
MNKEVSFGLEARKALQEGLDILANAVKATLGPRGRHAAIERPFGPPLITKDGVTVARSINLSDKLKNMGASLVKDVASSTNAFAGDGTTTATVLAQAIYTEGSKMVAAGYNPVLIKRGMDLAVEHVSDKLKEIAVSISNQDMLNSIAVISANNDRKLGEMIGEVVSTVGNDGLISVEESAGAETTVSYSDGLSFDRGYVTPAFSTNLDRLTVEYENPLILFYDGRISKTSDLMPVMEAVAEVGRPLLVVAQTVENEALQTMLLNNTRKALISCAVRAPGFGDIRRDILGDLTALCGGRVFNNDTEGQLKLVRLEDLGQARRVVVTRDNTSIIDGAGKQDLIDRRIESVRERMSQPGVETYELAAFKQRLSALSGSVAIFKVGGVSEAEVKEKKDRVEDAINAVRAAIEEGVVPGGGSAFLHCVSSLESLKETDGLTTEEIVGIDVVSRSIRAPFAQILSNAGMNYHLHMENIITSENRLLGFDALRGKIEDDMVSAGVIDPVKVVRTGLENAASSAGTLLTTEVAIFNESDPG